MVSDVMKEEKFNQTQEMYNKASQLIQELNIEENKTRI